MRIVISSIQQYLKNGTIKEIKHVSSKNQLSDVFTKKGVIKENIIHAVSIGSLKTPENLKWEKYTDTNDNSKDEPEDASEESEQDKEREENKVEEI